MDIPANQQEIKAFWYKIYEALQRLAAMAAFAVTEELVKWVLKHTVFQDGGDLVVLANNFGLIVYVLIYIILLLELLWIFAATIVLSLLNRIRARKGKSQSA